MRVDAEEIKKVSHGTKYYDRWHVQDGKRSTGNAKSDALSVRPVSMNYHNLAMF